MHAIPKPIIIGVCGRAQHGKSTLVRQLEDYFNGTGKTPRRTAFADPLKMMLATFGLGEGQLYGSTKTWPDPILGGKTARYAMQTLGTEWGRNMLYPDVWVDAWERMIEKDQVSNVILVEDVRFESEVKKLQSLGAILVEVYRPAKMPQTTWGWIKHWFQQRRVHQSERQDFARLGVPRLVAREGGSVLDDFLAMHPALR